MKFKIEAKNSDQNPDLTKDDKSKKGIEQFEKNRAKYENYAGFPIKIEEAQDGFAYFDLIENKLGLSGKFYEDRNFSEEKTDTAIKHEIKHFLDKKEMLAEEGGARKFAGYIAKLDPEKNPESSMYALMDNCIADMAVNRDVTKKTHGGVSEVFKSMYNEDLFPLDQNDFTSKPKHIQLCEALLVEDQVPGRVCQVSPEVRAKMDEIKSIEKNGVKLMDVMTNPETPMSIRHMLQDVHVLKHVRELAEQDKKEQENKDKDQNKEGKEGENKKGEGKSEESKGKQQKPQEGEGDKKGKGQKGEGDPKNKKGKSVNEIFKEEYEKAKKRSMNQTENKANKEALKKWQKEGGDDPLKKALREQAEKFGVEAQDLEQYRSILKELESIRNPDTNEHVIEELRNLIRRIIAKRIRPKLHPQYPVVEGDDLIDPATLVSEAQAGNFEPAVWETTEIKEKHDHRFGEIEITLVCDRSTSMNDPIEKLIEQQRATVMFMEALKEFNELCEEERQNMDKPLEVKSEVYSFQADSSDKTPVKEMSRNLSVKDCVGAMARMGSVSGTTTDFVTLGAIEKKLSEDEESLRKIKTGELKKIVVVFTDGGTDNPSKLSAALQKLAQHGVVVVGIGVTESGAPALESYKPFGRLAKNAADVPVELAKTLADHLAGV